MQLEAPLVLRRLEVLQILQQHVDVLMWEVVLVREVAHGVIGQFDLVVVGVQPPKRLPTWHMLKSIAK